MTALSSLVCWKTYSTATRAKSKSFCETGWLLELEEEDGEAVEEAVVRGVGVVKEAVTVVEPANMIPFEV